MRFQVRARWFALGAVLAGLMAGGIAYASIPDSNGVVHACYQKNSGSVHVIGTNPTVGGGACGSNELALDWNQTGPSGPSGPEGGSGQSGPSGPSGVLGREVVSNDETHGFGTYLMEAECPTGKVAVGGGGFTQAFSGNNIGFIQSFPEDFGSKSLWGVYAWNGTQIQVTFRVYAVCVTA